MIYPPESLDTHELQVFNAMQEMVALLYDHEETYEQVIGEIIALKQRLFAAYGKDVVRHTILYHLLLGSSIPHEVSRSSLRFDFDGDDSIAEFIRRMVRKYIPKGGSDVR